MFPDAPLIQRQGEVNAMDSKEFREALASINRTQVIIGGIATDVCKSSHSPSPGLTANAPRHHLCRPLHA